MDPFETENGEVRYDWFPKSVKNVYVELLDRGWKIEKIDNDKTPDGLTTVRVRRTFPVEGRLVLPSGVDARGILVTGSGFGGGNYGDHPSGRTRSDGSFTLHVPSDHGYVLGVYDREWTSNIWSGAILSLESQAQRKILLHGERAVPLEVIVTRGPLEEPVESAWLLLSRHGDVVFTDATGKAQRGSGRIGGWLRTDEKGRASTGVGRGQIEVLMHGDSWSERKTVQVASDEPVKPRWIDRHHDLLEKDLVIVKLTAGLDTDAEWGFSEQGFLGGGAEITSAGRTRAVV